MKMRRGADQNLFAINSPTMVMSEVGWVEQHIIPLVTCKLLQAFESEIKMIREQITNHTFDYLEDENDED